MKEQDEVKPLVDDPFPPRTHPVESRGRDLTEPEWAFKGAECRRTASDVHRKLMNLSRKFRVCDAATDRDHASHAGRDETVILASSNQGKHSSSRGVLPTIQA